MLLHTFCTLPFPHGIDTMPFAYVFVVDSQLQMEEIQENSIFASYGLMIYKKLKFQLKL